jgi:hypothetical protein
MMNDGWMIWGMGIGHIVVVLLVAGPQHRGCWEESGNSSCWCVEVLALEPELRCARYR